VEQFDFVVAGGGIAGMTAAISAARQGLKTALINDRPVLGGNASSEISVRIQGASHHGLNPAVYARETGIVDEIRQKSAYAVSSQGYCADGARDGVYFDIIYNEPNIKLFLNTTVDGVKCENGEIKSISCVQAKTRKRYRFSAKVFADCTGDGAVAFYAGCAFMTGSEAKSEFNEKFAPAEYEPYTMGNSLFFEIEDAGKPVKFVRPSFAHDVTKMNFMKDIENPKKFRGLYVSGQWWSLEYGGMRDTLKDSEEIALELRKLDFGLWDYVKNSGKFPEARNMKLKRVLSVPGTRESRRIVGDYILNENDIEEKRQFIDGVAVGGWPMDVHDPGGIYGNLPASNFISVTGLYEIPFRCLYARDIKNLMLAGRDISASHIAFGSLRVMGTCGAMGQAVGAAAAVCAKYDCNPRDIYEKHLAELKYRLTYGDQSILRNDDRINNVLKSPAEASSELEYENIAQTKTVRLLQNYGLALPITTDKLDGLKIKLKNETGENQNLSVIIMTGSHPETYLPDKSAKTLKLEIPASFYGWKEIGVNTERGADKKIYLVFLKNGAISLCAGDGNVPGAISWKYYENDTEAGYNHDTCPINSNIGFCGQDRAGFEINFKDVIPKQTVFAAGNVLNEYSRPYGVMNLWSAGKKQSSLTVKADGYIPVGEIHIVFDNSLNTDGKDIIPPNLVKDYDLICDTEEGITALRIRENIQRLNVHKLNKKINRAVIDILDTHGGNCPGIYSVKFSDGRG
jgi:hypothetical protein